MAAAGGIKKLPERRCAGCGEHFPKRDLVRVLRKPDGQIVLDLTGKISGRGAYVCDNPECIKKLKKTKGLNRVFSCEVKEEVYDKILEEFLDDKN